MGGNLDIDYTNFCDEQERENDMSISRADMLAYHRTMSALEKEMAKPEFDEKPHPLDYTEFELTKSATELLTLTSRAYVTQKLRDLANEFAVRA